MQWAASPCGSQMFRYLRRDDRVGIDVVSKFPDSSFKFHIVTSFLIDSSFSLILSNQPPGEAMGFPEGLNWRFFRAP